MLEQHYTDVKIMDSNVENVCKALKKREEKGMNTYGVSTDRTDLTTEEWLQHLQEELMDACVYIEKLKREFQSIPKQYNSSDLIHTLTLVPHPQKFVHTSQPHN